MSAAPSYEKGLSFMFEVVVGLLFALSDMANFVIQIRSCLSGEVFRR